MEVLGVTTTLSMWAHFAGAFFWAKQVKKYLLPSHAFLLVMAVGLLFESYQLSFTEGYSTIWWDSGIDVCMNGLGAFIAVRWNHE